MISCLAYKAQSFSLRLMLDQDTVIFNPVRRFCFCRLPFGLVSSRDLFQRVINEILSSIPNATPVADNIKIHGRTERDHDLALLRVLDKCQSAGLHRNLEKCQIMKQTIVRPCNLPYFNHKSGTEIQWDASLKGLAACIMQNGQPVSYASKSLTDTAISNVKRWELSLY